MLASDVLSDMPRLRGYLLGIGQDSLLFLVQSKVVRNCRSLGIWISLCPGKASLGEVNLAATFLG